MSTLHAILNGLSGAVIIHKACFKSAPLMNPLLCRYGVPAAAAALFESAFRRALPSQVKAQPELLFQLVTLLSPRVLQHFNVPVFQTAQRQGEFLITFPGVYHGGFNHGVILHRTCAAIIALSTLLCSLVDDGANIRAIKAT